MELKEVSPKAVPDLDAAPEILRGQVGAAQVTLSLPAAFVCVRAEGWHADVQPPMLRTFPFGSRLFGLSLHGKEHGLHVVELCLSDDAVLHERRCRGVSAQTLLGRERSVVRTRREGQRDSAPVAGGKVGRTVQKTARHLEALRTPASWNRSTASVSVACTIPASSPARCNVPSAAAAS